MIKIQNKNKKIFILASLVILFSLTPILLSSLNQNTRPEGPYKKESLATSGFWNLSFIHVDNNWSSTTSTYAWCSGDGSWDNPYLIENVTIDASSSPIVSGIWIQNSNDYFIIRNSTIFNAGSGSSGAGIRLTFIENGQFTKNTISDNYRGITLWNTDNCSFFDNSLIDNGGQGITLEYSEENKIIENTANGSQYYALFIASLSHNNTVLGNDFNSNTGSANDGTGIHIQYSLDCEIYENKLDYNEYGIRLVDGAENTTIYNNIIENNNIYGVYVDNSSRECVNNLFYNNTFNNPAGINAYDNGSNSEWDNGLIGNYWDDYGGSDNNDDGIGDSPYLIGGDANSQDDIPIWDDGDDVYPTFVRNSPSAPFTFGTSAPVFNLTIFDLNLDMAWYKINLTYTHYFTPVNGINIVSFNQTSWDALSEGTLSIGFFVNDTAGNLLTVGLSATKELPPEEPPSPNEIPFGYHHLVFLGIGVITLLLVQIRRGKYKFNSNS